MKLLMDIRNNNYYIVGKADNKTYLFNGICKFELTTNRMQHLEEIENNNTIIHTIIDRLKNQFPYDFNKIAFV